MAKSVRCTLYAEVISPTYHVKTIQNQDQLASQSLAEVRAVSHMDPADQIGHAYSWVILYTSNWWVIKMGKKMSPNWIKKLFPTTFHFFLKGAAEQQHSELIHIKSSHFIRPPDWLWNIQLLKLLYGIWQRLSTYKTKFPAIPWGLILGKSRHINRSTAVITSYKCGLANVFDLMNDISIQKSKSLKICRLF